MSDVFRIGYGGYSLQLAEPSRSRCHSITSGPQLFGSSPWSNADLWTCSNHRNHNERALSVDSMLKSLEAGAGSFNASNIGGSNRRSFTNSSWRVLRSIFKDSAGVWVVPTYKTTGTLAPPDYLPAANSLSSESFD